MFPHPFLMFQFEEVLVSLIRKVWYKFLHLPYQRLMKRNNLDCLQHPYLLQGLCSIPALQIKWFPWKFPTSHILILLLFGFVSFSICFSYFLFTFLISNLYSTCHTLSPFWLHLEWISILQRIVLQFHYHFLFRNIVYLLVLLWILFLPSCFLSYRGMHITFWSSSHAVYKESDFLTFDFRVFWESSGLFFRMIFFF